MNTINNRNVTFNPDIQITASFKGGKLFIGKLGELRQWAIDNEVDAPLGCTTAEGRHGLFPCIIAENERVASALTHMTGALISKDDGATFATRNQMREVARSLQLAGIRTSALACQWGITEQPYANSIKPVALPQQMTLAEQFADSPF